MSQLNPLTEEEKILIPKIIKVLLKTSKNRPIYTNQLIKGINERKEQFGLTNNFTGSRLRKIINFLRVNKLLAVISNKKGYYVSYDKEDIKTTIASLRERAASIQAAADGLEYLLQRVQAQERGDFFEPEDFEIDDFGFVWKKTPML